MNRPQNTFWIFFVAVLATVAVIWLPIGFSALPQIEEWEFFNIFQDDGPTFWVTGPQFAGHRLRPLFIFVYAVCFSLGTSHYLMHAALALALFIKGVSMAYIAHWLTRDKLIAVVTAVVFVVHPADTMQMGFRALVIVWPLAMSVAAVALLLISIEVDGNLRRLSFAVAAGLLFVSAGMMYEAALAMIVAPLILLLVRDGWGGIWLLRIHWPQAAIWSAALLVNILYVVLNLGGGPTYQGSILVGAPSIYDVPKHLFGTGLYRTFFQGWYDGFTMFAANVAYVPFLIGGFLIVVICFVRLSGGPKGGERGCPLAMRCILAGIVLAAVGYGPYLFSLSHIHISQRTYLFASFGGAIAAIGLLIIARRPGPVLFSFVAALLVVSGFGSQWEQFAHYTDLSRRQAMYLSVILKAAPDAGKISGQTIFINDRSGALASTWMLRGVVLPMALSYVYGRTIRAVVCGETDELYSSFTGDQYGVPGRCVRHDKGWTLGSGVAGAVEVSAENAIRLVVEPDGSVNRADGESKVPGAGLIMRARSILGCFPCSYQQRQPITASFKYDFGKWWSLEDVAWGGGWLDTAWVPPPRKPRSYAWMVAPESNLFFRIAPSEKTYRVSVKLVASISQEARDTFGIKINDHALKYDWQAADMMSGLFDGAILKNGLNEIRLSSIPGGQFTISNQVDWIEVAPP